jgi:hypothetical protein
MSDRPTRWSDLPRRAYQQRTKTKTFKTKLQAPAQSVCTVPRQTRRKKQEKPLDSPTSFRDDTPMRFRESAVKCCWTQQLMARETHRETTPRGTRRWGAWSCRGYGPSSARFGQCPTPLLEQCGVPQNRRWGHVSICSLLSLVASGTDGLERFPVSPATCCRSLHSSFSRKPKASASGRDVGRSWRTRPISGCGACRERHPRRARLRLAAKRNTVRLSANQDLL